MRAVFVAVLLLCVGRPAYAEEIAKVEDAKRLAANAQLHFDVGEYAQAAQGFREAYRTTPRPGLLYNLGQTYRLAGDCANAERMYRNYLRAEPRTPYRALVQQHLTTLGNCDQSARPSSRRARIRQRLGLGIGGVGVVLAIVGVGVHNDALVVGGAAATGAGTAMFLSWRF
jgi:tetratricopeptide (TPR) repeat protein